MCIRSVKLLLLLLLQCPSLLQDIYRTCLTSPRPLPVAVQKETFAELGRAGFLHESLPVTQQCQKLQGTRQKH